MPDRPLSQTDPLDDFTARQITCNGQAKLVYVAGRGRARLIDSSVGFGTVELSPGSNSACCKSALPTTTCSTEM